MTKTTRRRFLWTTAALSGAAALPGRVPMAAAAVEPVDDLAFATAIELAAQLRTGQVGSVELTRFFIERIERYDERLNAIPVRDFERALAAAAQADEAMARGEVLGPLHGLPMTIKESYDIAGLPTTWGFPTAADSKAAEDAVVVQRFKAAGAHFLGKTNVPVALGDFQSYNPVYGQTNNPWDVTRTPGGSSGGSAAALAAGLTGLDSGSDIGGSIRNPAHYCGVYGHKPTLSVVPVRGHTPPGIPRMPLDPDLAVVGPLARSAEDLALALDIVAGPDLLTSPGWSLELPPPRRTALGDLRVAVWPDEAIAPVDATISDRIGEVADLLARQGATVSDTARPEFDPAQSFSTYQTLLDAVTNPENALPHSAWAGLDGMRTGYRVAWQRFFQDWDVVLCPISSTTAFLHDHGEMDTRTLPINGEQRPYFGQLFWAALATLAYLPGTVFPTGLSAQGLPIGLQAIGPAFEDRTTIEFARLLAREIGGYQRPPGFEG